jgi:hypothetical protein
MSDLEHGVQLRDADIAAHLYPSPDQRADAESINRFSMVHPISLCPDPATWLLTPHFLVLSKKEVIYHVVI